MKLIKYFFLLAVVALSGCSGSDDNGDEQDLTAKFEVSINGVPQDMTQSHASKKDQTIHIGTDRNDTSFLISFDENGHLGKIIYTYYDPTNGSTKKFTSFRNFSSHYLNFQFDLDTVHKRFKGSFSGYIYYNPEDLTSESKYIECIFDLPYEDYIPPVANIVNKATINGIDWRATNQYHTRQIGSHHYVTLHSLSDDAYKLIFFFNDQNTLAGVYNFSNADLTNKMQIAKYNVSTGSYTFYDCTGTMTVTNKWYNCIQGTYSFTGVNPSDSTDIITVSNGNFKLLYDLNS